MKTIRYRSGYKYQLAETYSVPTEIRPDESRLQRPELKGQQSAGIVTDFIELDPHGTLTLKKGYAWDGPSGPTFDTKSFMRGSLVHDAFYQLMREEHLPPSFREAADVELVRLCREDGMNRFRAWVVLWGVRKGAGFAARPENRKPIRSAP